MVKPSKQNLRDLARSVLTMYMMSNDFAELESRVIEEKDNSDFITPDEINKFILHSQLSLRGFLVTVGANFHFNVNADIFHGIMLSTLQPQPQQVPSTITLHLVCDDGPDTVMGTATLNLVLSADSITHISADSDSEDNTFVTVSRKVEAELS